MRKSSRSAAGSGKVTLGMVAEASGVSPSTVSRILNGTAIVSEEKRAAVDRAIEALKAAIAPNRCFYGWEHRFLWSRCLLTEFLEAAGFEEVRYCAYGESELPHFRGIERHLREPETPELPHVLIVEARKGEPRPERLARLRELIADDFLRHLSPDSVLERGYSLVQQADGSIVRDSTRLAPAEPLKVTFARGQAEVRVEKISD